MNLVDGAAYHKGFATWQATRDWQLTLQNARAAFEADLDKAGLDINLDLEVENHWDMIVCLLEEFKSKWQDKGMQILQPECEFIVDIPNSHHNDITLHWTEIIKHENATHWDYEEHWGMPTPEAISEGRVCSPHFKDMDEDCPCWQPHRLYGRADGIITQEGNIWLQEHKGTARLGDLFWGQWYLDIQLTAYVWAVWKTLGVKPKGVVLNAMYKPSEGMVNSWNAKRKEGTKKGQSEYIKLHRENFERSEQDCLRFEREFKQWADSWERSILTGSFPMSPLSGHCLNYNRKCDYFDLCVNHDQEEYTFEMWPRDLDYVDEARQKQLIQITGTPA